MPEPQKKLSETTERLYASVVELIPQGRAYSMASIQAMIRNRIGITDSEAMSLVLVMVVRGALVSAGDRKVMRV